MMIGTGTGNLVQVQAGDTCLNFSTGQPEPCSSQDLNLMCMQTPTGGSIGPTCASFTAPYHDPTQATPIPILTLGDILQRCPNYGCQIATTWSNLPSSTGGITAAANGCDPLIMAAGYACQASDGYAIYSRTNQDPVVTPNQLGLTPSQTSYLIQTGIIQPITSMNTPVTPVYAPPIPTSGPAAPQSVINSYISSGVPQAAALPTPTTYIPNTPETPAATGPNTVALGIQPGVVGGMNPPAGTIPGSNTAAAMGPNPAAPTTDTSGDLLPGIPNNYLYIGGAALLLLLVMKK